MLDSLKDERISVKLKKVSPKIYEVQCRTEFTYMDYMLFEEENIKVKVQKGDTISLEYEEDIKKGFSRLQERIKQCENVIKKINHITTLPYIKSIIPYSHWASEKYNLCTLHFNIEFEDYVHNQYIKESIGKISIIAIQLSESLVEEKYNRYKKEALVNLENEFIKYALKNNELYQTVISELNDICKETGYLQIKVSSDNRRIILLDSYSPIFEYEYTNQELLGVFENEVKQVFMSHIEKQIAQHNKVNSYVNIINSCRNKIWYAEQNGNMICLCLCDSAKHEKICHKHISLCQSDDIKKDILDAMKSLLQYAENHCRTRFLEDYK